MTVKRTSPNAFGVVLRTYRLQNNLSQEQLSERVNVVRSFICSLESGKKRPSLDMAFQLVNALGANPGEFMAAVAEKMNEK